jgi:hypothetical protein
MGSDVMLEFLPFGFDVKMFTESFEGAGKPSEEAAE